MIKSQPSAETVLDRQCEQRSEPGYLEPCSAIPSHRVVLLHRGKALLQRRGAGLPGPRAPPGGPPAGTITVFLGKVNDGHGHQLPAGTALVLQVLPYDAGLDLGLGACRRRLCLRTVRRPRT